jgi:hypothetical protein
MLDPYLDAIAAVCRRWGVRRLELFGSALTDRFDPKTSDLDFLVLYDRPQVIPPDRAAWTWLDDELRAVVGRPVDVIDICSARNPYFLSEALKNRAVVYARSEQ